MKHLSKSEFETMVREIIPYPKHFQDRWLENGNLCTDYVLHYYHAKVDLRSQINMFGIAPTVKNVENILDRLFDRFDIEANEMMLIDYLPGFSGENLGLLISGKEVKKFLAVDYPKLSNVLPFFSIEFHQTTLIDIANKRLFYWGDDDYFYSVELEPLWERKAELDNFYPPIFMDLPTLDDRFISGNFRVGFSDMPTYPPTFYKMEELLEIYLPRNFPRLKWFAENISKSFAQEIAGLLESNGISVVIEQMR